MAILKFKAPTLSKYCYDTAKEQVLSNQNPNKPFHPLKWAQQYGWSPKRVTLVHTNGTRSSFTQSEIMNFLEDIDLTTTASKAVTTADCVGTSSINSVVPNGEFVLFSTTNKASQYFYKGTSIGEALGRFARRNVHIKPEDIRVLEVETGVVRKAQVKVVKTMALS